ncbi:MAG: COX15/CtaA family protein [Rhizobiales bacterium]|nr:COX15/CtaA family protein [Hyphomicrobiales bacterium]
MTTVFDLQRDVESNPAPTTARHLAAIRFWLFSVLGLIAAMVVVGGATRLTDSGLSITEWKPLLGAIPPLSHADWIEAFDKYRQIPEYQLVNKGMSLADFQFIYWWEWAHRFLGRIIGLAFFVPAVMFWVLGWLPKALKPRIVVLFLLGGLQGVIGWWMVASGLVDRVDVSQYRLAIHLTLACVLFAAVLWVATGLRQRTSVDAERQMLGMAWFLIAAVLFQIFAGGLVAGMDAGLAYNTWPAMDGSIVPGGLFAMSPFWVNLFENAKTVQFNHRMIAYALWLLAIGHAVWVVTKPVPLHAKIAAGAIAAAVSLQAVIGILTLVMVVPLNVALMHQFGALIVLAAAVLYARVLKGPSGFIA